MTATPTHSTADTVALQHWGQTVAALPEPTRYEASHAGIARQFIDRNLHAVRYVPAFGRWLLWDTHRWKRDEDGGIVRRVMEHSQRLLAESADFAGHEARTAAARHAVELGNVQTMDPMLRLAKCDARIVLGPDQLDAESFLLGVKNGVVDLRTGLCRAGRQEDFITKQAGAAYELEAKCPRWEAFLEEVLAGDAELIAYVQKLVGYTLTGEVTEQCFPFLFGGGRNGKSVFTETLYALLGEYGQRAPQSLLIASQHGREPANETARLQGARLAIGSETEEGTRLAESRVKDLTGGDTLTGRFLYQSAFDFRPRLKLWLFGNHKPEIRGTDEGIWRRVRLIPFLVQIPEERRDPELKSRLAAELPGILRWAIEGTRRWLDEGLAAPACVREASAEYRDEEDSLADFISDELEVAPGSRVDTGAVFVRYQEWAQKNGVRFVLSQRTLTKRLRERGMTLHKANGRREWIGFQLQ